ncbi:hypothetical protein ZIOFF_062689 [Zingiber officinale]|uniref:Uncharacterized protein n=1 Tax=Zingiber officinale TaxID=94328 RepID=A0A8J5F0Q1_ZINOF|nr:hypothetical protein ZIOFF_062689 [Zingiber officinale]
MMIFLFAAPGRGTKNCFIDSIYSFGDSIADTGNLLRQGAVGMFAPIGRFPYGKTMNNATGRCSDGLLMIDYFECSRKLEHALILMGEIGGNDYNNAFFQGTSIDSVKSFVPQVVDRIVSAAKEVIDAGAVQLVIPGNFPIGCMPSYLTMFYSSNPSDYDDNNCLKDYNSFAMYHNQQLQAATEKLRQSYPKVTLMYADYYQAFMYLLNNAAKLGFDKDSVHEACCGAGGTYNFDIKLMCGLPGTSTCSDPTKYISWDGIHLTQEAYKTMAQALIMQGFAFPNHNIHNQWKC